MARGGDILTIRGGIGIGVSVITPTIVGGDMAGDQIGATPITIHTGDGVVVTIRHITEWVIHLTTEWAMEVVHRVVSRL